MSHGWSEAETTLGEIKGRIRAFLRERNWEDQHSPKNLALSIGIEAGELMEIFQWVDSREAEVYCKASPDRFHHVQQEIADVVIYCVSMANALGFDLAAALDHKIDHNATRYPRVRARGSEKTSLEGVDSRATR